MDRCDLLIVREEDASLAESLFRLIMKGSKKIEYIDIAKIGRATEIFKHLRPRVVIIEGLDLAKEFLPTYKETDCKICVIVDKLASRKVILSLGIETYFKKPLTKKKLQAINKWIRKSLPE